MCSTNWLLKGGVIAALLWGSWFRNRDSPTKDRELLLSGIFLSMASLVVARTLALTLPFRERPRYNPLLHFSVPTGTADTHLIHWSSFPSDNAALFFALATCLFLVSRRLGAFAYCHALFLVTLPRIYLGFHYPTDILGGALLGICMASLASLRSVRSSISRLPLRWLENCPGSFYGCFYLGTFLLATEFDPLRSAALEVLRMIRGLPHIP